MSDIQSYIETHMNEIICDIKQLVQLESPTSDKKAVDQAGKWIQNAIKNYLGITPDVIKQSETGDHITFEIGQGDEQILLSGHFDTVWNSGDLELIEENNVIYGPGVIDMKTGIVQILWSLRALRENNITLDKRVKVFFNGDHEGIASPTSRPYIEEAARHSKYGLVAEAATGEHGALKTFRKGIYRYAIQFHGKSSHAGNDHEEGESAILEAAIFTQKLEELTDYEQGITVNVGLISGGKGINVRPDYAEIKVDVRVTENERGQQIDEQIKSISSSNEKVKIEITGGEVRPVMKRTKETEVLFSKARNYANELGFDIEEVAVGGGSDGSFIAAQGTPTLDGLGGVGGGPHARNEHINTDYVSERTSLLATLIEKL